MFHVPEINIHFFIQNNSDVHSAFFTNVKEFRKLDYLQVNINFCNRCTVQQFVGNMLKLRIQFLLVDQSSQSVHQDVFAYFVEVMQNQNIFINSLVNAEMSLRNSYWN